MNEDTENENIEITSTSRYSAECQPIVLRQSDRIRLVFIPKLVNNTHNKYACLKGTFVYQRKKKTDEWENIRKLDLSQLKAGEGVKLEIKSEEFLHLLRRCADLYRIYKSEGIPFGKNKFVKLSDELSTLKNINKLELRQFLELNRGIGIDTFNSLVQWIADMDLPDEIISKLTSLDIKSLRRLNSIVGLSNIKKCLGTWETNENNAAEEFWQKTLRESYFVLSNIFPVPVILVKDKAYVGGKTIYNAGANLVDFLYKNELTDNAVLIEIKTPCTPLLSGLYRGIYNISNELSGASLQVANYRYSLSKQYNNLTNGNTMKIQSFNPTCVVIIGNASRELNDDTKQKSFELFRNSQRDVQIITYDELFGKIRGLISLLESGTVG